jgi:hypothetical protein
MGVRSVLGLDAKPIWIHPWRKTISGPKFLRVPGRLFAARPDVSSVELRDYLLLRLTNGLVWVNKNSVEDVVF